MLNFTIQENAFFVARKKQGKTQMSKNFLNKFSENIIYDTNIEHRLEDYGHKHKRIVKNPDEFLDAISNIRKHDLKNYTLIIQFEKQNDDFFAGVLHAVYRLGNHRFHVEEIQTFVNPHYIPEDLTPIITRNRHKNMGYSFTSVSPSLIPKLIFGQLDLLFVGDLQSKNDRKYFDDHFENTDILKNQKQFHFKYYNLNDNKIIEVNNSFEILNNTKESEQ